MKRLILTAALLLGTLCLLNAQEIKSQWEGKKVAILGDSISDPALAERSGWKCWWAYLEDMLGIDAISYAHNGWQMNGMVRQAENLYNERAMEFDAILVFCGTNDFNASIPLGEWYDEETLEVNKNGTVVSLRHRIPVMSDTTFCGRINIMMDYLRTTYPTKQVILITPIHRGYARFGETNVQPDELYSNAVGKYIDDYVEAIRQAGNVWSAPVIDLFSTCGILPNNPEHGRYVNKTDTDRLHPSSEGHRRMAQAVAYQLIGYPSTCR